MQLKMLSCLISSVLIWLGVSTLYVWGTILEKSRAKLCEGEMWRGSSVCGGEMSTERGSAKQKKNQFSSVAQYTDDWVLVHTLSKIKQKKKVKFSQAVFKEDTHAPLAPTVFVLVVLLGQHVVLFLKNQLTPVARASAIFFLNLDNLSSCRSTEASS